MAPLRRRNARYLHDAHFGPSMTPMVDVVLVILIFFMASAALLASDRLLDTALPAKEAGPADAFALPPAHLLIELRRADGRTMVSGGGLTPPGTAAEVSGAGALALELAGRTRTESLSFVIEVDDDVPYEDLVRVRDALAAAGFERVGLK